MNMCVPIKKKKTKDVAFIVIRKTHHPDSAMDRATPIAIFENQEDAEDMVGLYTQEMKDRDITQIEFKVIATAFYPE